MVSRTERTTETTDGRPRRREPSSRRPSCRVSVVAALVAAARPGQRRRALARLRGVSVVVVKEDCRVGRLAHKSCGAERGVLGSTTGRPAPPVPREGKYFEIKSTLIVELSRDCWRSAVGIARSGLGPPWIPSDNTRVVVHWRQAYRHARRARRGVTNHGCALAGHHRVRRLSLTASPRPPNTKETAISTTARVVGLKTAVSSTFTPLNNRQRDSPSMKVRLHDLVTPSRPSRLEPAAG